MRRAIAAICGLALTFAFATAVTVTHKSVNYSEIYPPVVCPPTLSGLSSQISIASPQTRFQPLGSRSGKTTAFNSLRYLVSKDSLVVTANGVTPVVWQARAGKWAGGTLCSGPINSQWFVGGSSDVTSQGSLLLVNSGLSDAIVDVQPFSEKGKRPLLSINLISKSFKVIPLDSLATGDKSLSVHVVPRSGRINAFMIDERGTGLKALGGDFVNPISSPSNTLIIPAIPNQLLKTGKKNTSSHTLRILTPSDVGATFTLQIISSDGSFVPVGFNSRNISPGVVSEFELSPQITANAFAVRITSNEPIVAAISSKVSVGGGSDFVWSVPTTPLVPMGLAIAGLSPVIIFTADVINVRIDVTYLGGKKSEKSVVGSDIAIWRVPNGVQAISIIKSSANTYAGALVVSDSGYGYLPLTPGSLLTRVEVPHSNIRVLNP